MSPGTTSAMGLLVTDIKHDYSATLIQRADRLDAELVNRRYREMEARGEKALLAEGMGHARSLSDSRFGEGERQRLLTIEDESIKNNL